MEKAIVKEGVALAEKEQREKQVQEVKNIVLKTLEKKRALEKERDERVEKIKILNMDLEDLKLGKLDRIVERQEKDEKAKQTSVVVIIKEKVIVEHHYDPWYVPYRIVWNPPYYPVVPSYPMISFKQNCDDIVSFDNQIASKTTCNAMFTSISCSAAKDATIGAYTLDGTVVNLR